MKNCTRASFEKLFFPILFGTPLAKDRFLVQNFRLFGYLAIAAKILKDFSKNNYFEKNEVRAKTMTKSMMTVVPREDILELVKTSST